MENEQAIPAHVWKCTACVECQATGIYCHGDSSCSEWLFDFVRSHITSYSCWRLLPEQEELYSMERVRHFYDRYHGDSNHFSGPEIMEKLDHVLDANYRASINGSDRLAQIQQYLFRDENRVMVKYIVLEKMCHDEYIFSKKKVNVLMCWLAKEAVMSRRSHRRQVQYYDNNNMSEVLLYLERQIRRHVIL
jgi:hypothetical protein